MGRNGKAFETGWCHNRGNAQYVWVRESEIRLDLIENPDASVVGTAKTI